MMKNKNDKTGNDIRKQTRQYVSLKDSANIKFMNFKFKFFEIASF